MTREELKYRNGFRTPQNSSMPITGNDKKIDPPDTTDEILSKNPSFNPFTTTFENPDDYRGSEAEVIDAEFLKLYQALGIDIGSYASKGLPNPLNYKQVPKDLQNRLPLLSGSAEIRFFLNQVNRNLTTNNNMLNYEPNYVYSMMKSFPRVLDKSVGMFTTETDWLQKLLDELPSYSE